MGCRILQTLKTAKTAQGHYIFLRPYPENTQQWNSNHFFWIIYSIATFVISIMHFLIDWEYKSLVLIIALVVLYLALKMTINVQHGRWQGSHLVTLALWWCGFVVVGMTTLFLNFVAHIVASCILKHGYKTWCMEATEEGFNCAIQSTTCNEMRFSIFQNILYSLFPISFQNNI